MWYEHSTWRNLVDMHIPDWREDMLSRLDAEDYAQALEESGADTAIVYCGSCLGICYWPTKVGHRHAGLRGRDFVAEVTDACRKRGMKTILYFNIWSRWAYDTYPLWRMQTADGNDTCHPRGGLSRFGRVCMNAEGYREYVKTQIRDLVSGYPCEGLWIDMIGWYGTVCYCPHCRKRYKEETRRELPRRVDWYDPDWLLFQRKREEWYADFAEMIRAAAKEIRPDLTLAFQSGSWQHGWGGAVNDRFLQANDYLAADFYGDPLLYSVICKYVNHLTPHRPMEYMTSRCLSLEDHTTTKSESELLSSIRGAFVHNAAFVYIDAIDPKGTLNHRFHQRIGKLRSLTAPIEREVSCSAEVIADAAVYFNPESAVHVRDCGKDVLCASRFSVTDHMKTVARSLIRAHIAYDMIGRPQLRQPEGWPLVILCDPFSLTDQEADAFRAYVRGGGRLLVTGRCGLIDGFRPRSDFPLKDVLGVSFLGELPEDTAYMAPTPAGKPFFPDVEEGYPLYVRRQFMRVRAQGDTEVLAETVRPCSRTDEIFHFGSAISNPPDAPAGCPAVTLHRFGQGEAMYAAAALEWEDAYLHRDVFAALVRRLIPDPRIRVGAPPWLEVLVTDDPAQRVLRLSAFNCLSEQDAAGLIARDVTIRLKTAHTVRRAAEVGTGFPVPWEDDGGALILRLPEFTDFFMIRAEY